MQTLIVILRLVHIGTGVFWAGTVFFTTFFLFPAIQDTGPDGGKVMGALARRGFLQLLPALSVLNILSGVWLFWILSAGFSSGYVHSRIGMVLAVSGLVAIVTFVIGIVYVRPAAQRSMQIAQTLPNLTGRERDEAMATVTALRARTAIGARLTAILLALTVVGMAVARYV